MTPEALCVSDSLTGEKRWVVATAGLLGGRKSENQEHRPVPGFARAWNSDWGGKRWDVPFRA